MSGKEYAIRKVEKLPPSRVGAYQKVVDELEKAGKGIYEVSMEGRKAANIVTTLRKKLDKEKFKAFTRANRAFVEVL